MMKTLLIICLLCSLGLKSYAQENEEDMLLGEQRFSDLFENAKTPWFKQNYNLYPIKKQLIPQLKNHVESDVQFIVFGGSWCDDTQNLIPKFYKVIHETGFNDQYIHLYFVDRDKKSPEEQEDGLNITKVPTIIVYRNGIEIGRIIEVVNQTIEADLLEIFNR